jgi:hypothetical protein
MVLSSAHMPRAAAWPLFGSPSSVPMGVSNLLVPSMQLSLILMRGRPKKVASM